MVDKVDDSVKSQDKVGDVHEVYEFAELCEGGKDDKVDVASQQARRSYPK